MIRIGVKLSAIILAGPTVLSAVGACPPHDGVRRRWWINVASAVSLRARKKSGDLTTAIVPAGTSFPACCGSRLTPRRRMPAPNPPSPPSTSRRWMLTPLKQAGSRRRPSAGRGLVSITMRGLTSARTSRPSGRVAGESVSNAAIWCFFVFGCPGRTACYDGRERP
jgi:hypothetical protein